MNHFHLYNLVFLDEFFSHDSSHIKQYQGNHTLVLFAIKQHGWWWAQPIYVGELNENEYSACPGWTSS